MEQDWIYAAVAQHEDGSETVIGTCAVAAGAAAFAVSCGSPRARVVKIPPTTAAVLARLIFDNALELTAEDETTIGAACARALDANSGQERVVVAGV